MKSKILVVVSIILNIALMVVILQSLRARTVVVPVGKTNNVVHVVAVAAPNSGLPQSETAATPVVQEFHWSQVVSTDFKIYRDNLRAFHCPDQTIRDIINSEINEFFAEKRRGFLEQLQLHFWELAARGQNTLDQNEYSKALEELSQERERLIKEVLGGDPSDAEENQTRLRKELDGKYTWLPAEKRDRMIALEEKYQQEIQFERSYVAGQSRRDKITKDFEDAKKQLLSPEEYQELEFCDSDSSGWAARLSGLEVNEAEWRTVGKLMMKASNAAGMESGWPARASIGARAESEIKAILGEERYAQYQLSTDSNYQLTRRIMKRYDLPDSVTLQAHQMQQIAIGGANEIRANPNLSPETKQAALAAIQQETERSLNSTLGQKVFGTYQKYNGDWLKQLDQMKPESSRQAVFPSL